MWRILSHCNYYPVLVQTFCAGLLESLTEATVRRPHGIGEITDRQVRDALENEGIRREIEAKFGYTQHLNGGHALVRPPRLGVLPSARSTPATSSSPASWRRR